jgi:alpha-tubulin suppressor-like RCC1 family protein
VRFSRVGISTLLLLLAAGCPATPHHDRPVSLPVGVVLDIAAYGDRTCVLDGGGAPFCFGNPLPAPVDDQGYLVPVALPFPGRRIALGADHACAAIDGGVVCWGDNLDGALGIDAAACPPPPYEGALPSCDISPAIVPGVDDVSAIAAGERTTCVIRTADARVLCWGANAPPASVMTDTGVPLSARKIALGARAGCAIDTDDALWCWGGGLGVGFGAAATLVDPGPVLDVAIGEAHVCRARADGTTVCRGENLNGQAGDVDAARACPESPCRVDDTVVPLPSPAVLLTAGARHTCAADADGVVACWGSNEHGQLARSDAFLVGAPGGAWGVADAVALTSGRAHTCARVAAGYATCWGLDATGQIGGLP